MEKHPLHIKNPELQTSPEVEQAVKRQERMTGERVPNDPSARLEAYMDRLENIFLHPDERKRERNLDMLRPKIYDALIIKRENFPESYFDLQQRIARERGAPAEHIQANVREQMIQTAIEDQKASLDAWINYLTSDDAVYPPWFKYFVWKNIIKLSQFDKERGEFKRRTDTTVAPFPDIYREPLAQIADLYEQVKQDNKKLKEPELKVAFSKKFPTLYAELILRSLEQKIENPAETTGQWVKYTQGQRGEAEKLYRSLESKKTGWCTAGKGTADLQIQSGDFYVYYTNNEQGQPIQPRMAIRMAGQDKIAEVRGILPGQNLEPSLVPALDLKLKEFGPEAEAYQKKSADMKYLTKLERKQEKNEPFTKDDLTFLYELNSKIESFGYEYQGRDPRIQELRAGRNLEQDMLIIFDCTKEQIAHVPSQINQNTKAYVGQLEPGIFEKLPETLEHIYTSFPDKKIRREQIEIGGQTVKELEKALKQNKIQSSDYANKMLESKDFTTEKQKETIHIVRLTVADLGFKNGATTDQIYQRAKELGLELCPPEVGPQYRLKYQDQPLGEWIAIGMKQITDADGGPRVFDVERDEGGLWLDDYWAEPDSRWNPGYSFIFVQRKPR